MITLSTPTIQSRDFTNAKMSVLAYSRSARQELSVVVRYSFRSAHLHHLIINVACDTASERGSLPLLLQIVTTAVAPRRHRQKGLPYASACGIATSVDVRPLLVC